MRPDFITLKNWELQHKTEAMAPDAFLTPNLKGAALRGTAGAKASATDSSYSIMNLVPSYKLRNQGACGSCWVWASTALTEVDLNTQYGITDRLSIQYTISNMTKKDGCGGGTVMDFANWYNNGPDNKNPGVLVPWSNPQAAYADSERDPYQNGSVVKPGAVGLIPSYQKLTLTANFLNTFDVSQAQAIANIKNALLNGQAVGFSFYTNFDSPDGFQAFWDNQPESAIWTNNYENGVWNSGDPNWGGHMVTIVGWDTDATTGTPYWVVLNQWGTSTGRPNQAFHLPMNLNYGALVTSVDPSQGSNPMLCYRFETITLSLPGGVQSPAGTAATPVATLPTTINALLGQEVVLTPTITAGTPPFTYQWSVDMGKGQGPQIVPGATSETLTLPNGACAATTGALDASWNGASATLTITDSFGHTVTPPPATLNVIGTALNADTGFEDGTTTSAWTFLDQTPVIPFFKSTAVNGGNYYARLTGYGLAKGNSGILTSTPVTLPAPGTPLFATYYLDRTTLESAPLALGTCTIQVVDGNGNLVKILKTHTNMDVDHLAYAPETFDITSLNTGQPGGPTQLSLQAVWSDPDARTIFRLDDAMILTGGSTSNPSITSWAPAFAVPGAVVTLTGANFTGARTVNIGRTQVNAFVVSNATTIRALVPVDATTGPITVATANGTISSLGNFYVAPYFISNANAYTAQAGAGLNIPEFSPASAGVGATIQLYGLNFTDASAVTFNGVSAKFRVLNNTMMLAQVPAGATEGPIVVTTPGGQATSAESFEVINTPTITGISTTSATAGSTISVFGTGLATATNFVFGKTPASNFYPLNDGSAIVVVPSGATTGLITATNPAGSCSSATPFTILSPYITSASTPYDANRQLLPFYPGVPVTLTGSGFLDLSSALLGTLPLNLQVLDNEHATFVLPGEVASGTQNLVITSPEGASNAIPIQTLVPTPVVAGTTNPGFAPVSGIVGTSVKLTGKYFTGTTSVAFNGVNAPNFTVVDDSDITVQVPATAMTGTISVTTASGTFTTKTPFTVGLGVLINQTPDNILAGSVYPFTAGVSGTATQTVTWSIQEGKAGGKIDASGNYTATSNPGVYHIVATSTVDPTVSATLAVQVNGANLNPATSGTGEVSVVDLAYFINAYGSKLGAANYTALADLNGDGVIDDKDLILFLGAF